MCEKIVVTSLICEEIVVYKKNVYALFEIRADSFNLWGKISRELNTYLEEHCITSTMINGQLNPKRWERNQQQTLRDLITCCVLLGSKQMLAKQFKFWTVIFYVIYKYSGQSPAELKVNICGFDQSLGPQLGLLNQNHPHNQMKHECVTPMQRWPAEQEALQQIRLRKY